MHLTPPLITTLLSAFVSIKTRSNAQLQQAQHCPPHQSHCPNLKVSTCGNFYAILVFDLSWGIHVYLCWVWSNRPCWGKKYPPRSWWFYPLTSSSEVSHHIPPLSLRIVGSRIALLAPSCTTCVTVAAAAWIRTTPSLLIKVACPKAGQPMPGVRHQINAIRM